MSIEDDDRIYFINTDWVRENVRMGEMPPVKFELVPTDDPNKWIYRVSAPMPKIYIKSTLAHEWDEIS